MNRGSVSAWSVLLVICCLLLASPTRAQSPAQTSFSFLTVTPSARLGGLSGVNVSLPDRDVNFVFSNPALQGDTLSGFASANYQFYVADIGNAMFTYAPRVRKLGMISIGVQHMNFGSISGYDATGAPTNDFRASETMLLVSKNHQVRNFRFGISGKVMMSGLAGYRASAIAFDVGGLFVHPEEQLTIGLVFKNAGLVVSDYLENSSSRLPFDVQAGLTFKPEHMPVRFSFTAFNLATRTLAAAEATAVSRAFNHVAMGAEILVHRFVTVLAGYRHDINQSLRSDFGGGGAGLSVGFAADLRSFAFAVSRGGFLNSNAGYSFTISKNIDTLIKKR